MNKSIDLLMREFESSSGKTEQWINFYKTFKSEFTKELKSIGATEIKFHENHFCLSGFFRAPKGFYYFSLADVRIGSYRYRQGELMYRAVKHNKDYTGGHNQYVKIESGMGKKMNID